MVLGINHPDSTGGDSSPRDGIRIWKRAWDASALLYTVLVYPNFVMHFDQQRIYSIGFSKGGATALQLGGLRGDIAAFKVNCTRSSAHHRGYAYFAVGGVDYNSTLAAELNQDLRELRISDIVCVDLGLANAYTDPSIAPFDHPILLIALG